MPYVKRKRGQNYLMVSTRRPDGTRGARLLAYLGRHRTLEAAIADLTEKLEDERALARCLDLRAAKYKRAFLKLNWVPARVTRDGSKVWPAHLQPEYEEGMPVFWHTRWMADIYANPVLDYWAARAACGDAEVQAEKLEARLAKLRAVAVDLERAGAGAPPAA